MTAPLHWLAHHEPCLLWGPRDDTSGRALFLARDAIRFIVDVLVVDGG